MRTATLIWKTAVVSLLVIAANVAGNYTLLRGMHDFGEVATFAPGPYIHALFTPWVAAGVALMAGWFLLRLVLLSWADLSYVAPITAFAYVLTAIIGHFFLHERVSALHWAGILVITLGVGVVAITDPETTPVHAAHTPERPH